VNPGKLDEYLARVKSLQGVLARVEASGSIEAWQVTAGGPATGTVLVVLEYPSLVSYAESDAKTRGDAEYSKLISGLDELRTLESSSLYRLVSGAETQGDIPTGSVLQSISVQVKPGRLDDYVAKIEQLRKISERVGNSSNMRVWQATAAGEATGTVVIGLIHKDLAAYAADSAKTQADSEWQALVGGLDEMRTIVSSGLARNVGP
jgi:20S proteasome alpha/beta subunit